MHDWLLFSIKTVITVSSASLSRAVFRPVIPVATWKKYYEAGLQQANLQYCDLQLI